MSLLDKFDAMTAVRAELTARGLRPFGAINEKIISPTEGTIAGKRVILAGTHNYLNGKIQRIQKTLEGGNDSFLLLRPFQIKINRRINWY